jgi:GNAT superfamily N-acetyltransferase
LTVLSAPDGTRVAEVRRDETADVRWAAVTLLAPVAVAAPVLLARLAGHRVVTVDEALVEALVAAGGQVRRRAHDYELDLTAVPPSFAQSPVPQGFRLSRDLDPVGLAEAHDLANPPGHPDHEAGLDHVEDLRSMIAGRILGPLVPEASWQVNDAAGPCGAILVVDRPPSLSGARRAWVVDVFVHPRHQGRGLGGALLRRGAAGAAAAGHALLGLAVSDGNPARAAYERIGFRHRMSGANVDLPPGSGGQPEL